jgi:hypothetical protein
MKLIWFFVFLTMGFVGLSAEAQSQKAMVINQGAMVYKEADFDAPVLGELKAGQVYDVSLTQKGPFYKIRVKPGVLGWIADTDIRLSKGGKLDLKKGAKAPEKTEEKKNFLEKKRARSFYASRYRGPTLAMLSYSENTMGALRSQSLPFMDLKWRVRTPCLVATSEPMQNFYFTPALPITMKRALVIRQRVGFLSQILFLKPPIRKASGICSLMASVLCLNTLTMK